PVIDGRIEEKEWRAAAAVTGFVNYGFPPTPLPQFLQPVWYLGYDDENFYLAHKYPVFPPGSLRARARTRDQAEAQFFSESILADDHTEIQMVTIGRENAIRGHFYKFMTNPWDAVSDQKVQYSIGQFGSEYQSRISLKSTFTRECWQQEIAIPLKDLNETKGLNGRRWVLQLVSAQDPGGNFYSWAYDGHWLHADRHPEVLFDDRAVAFQFLSLGDWLKGNPQLRFQVFNPFPEAKTLSVQVKVTDPEDKLLFAQEKAITVHGHQSVQESISGQNIPLSERTTVAGKTRDNLLTVTVIEPGTNKVYYSACLPVIPESNPGLQRYLQNLQSARKPAEPELFFAYLPSYNILKAEANIGVLGLAPEVASQTTYFRASFGQEGGPLLGLNTAAFDEKGVASLIFNFPPLAEGQYWVNLELLDARGKSLLVRKETFERRFFPFENNMLGLSERVIPPYQPIGVKEKTLKFTSGDIYLSSLGLPEQFCNRLVPVNQEILARPVRLFLEQSGQRSEVRGNGINRITPGEVKTEVLAEGEAGRISFQVKGEAEYDGQYLITLDLKPQGVVPVEKLFLEIPLKNPVDVIRIGSGLGSCYFNKLNPYSRVKNGLLWENGPEEETYMLFLGNGERGLYWYTDSYQGWHLRFDRTFMRLERNESSTVLRIWLVNDPFLLKENRRLRFAFLMVPVKPLPSDFRERQWDNEKSHVGGGSWWGTIGTFVFPQKPEEWFYAASGIPFEYKGHKVNAGFTTIPYPEKGPDGKSYWSKNKEYGAYRAADLIGYLQPEFKVFSGEWVDRTNPPLQPDPALLKYVDQQGQPVWPEPEQRAVYLKDCLTKSFVDFEVYYFYQMARNTGVGGYWWDWNSFRTGHSLLKGSAYLADDGSLRPRNSIFNVREMYQRIAVLCHQLGVPNTNNVYAPGPLYQVSWIERINAWESLYLETEGDDMFTAHGLDKYRATIGKYSGLPVTIVMNIPINLKDHRARSVIALSLLHDNGIWGIWKPQEQGTITKILREAGYFSPETEWIPYWRSNALVETSRKEMLTTLYRRQENKLARYLIVLVNPGENEVKTDLSFPGKKSLPVSVTDLETGQKLTCSNPRGKSIAIPAVAVPSHEFRFLAVTFREKDEKK
ncbi:MAG TPA: DUF6067 family protein, partial [bacterium]|nr:DUF6067 family protein [bacterium]